MVEEQIKGYEQAHPSLLMIDSDATGLQYFVEKEMGDSRIAVSGQKGITIVTREQAMALVDEIMDIFDIYTRPKGRKTNGALGGVVR